jgi:DNA-binding response OmpR family regulator
MTRLLGGSVVIGIAGSSTERAQLARLLGGSDAVLIVSSADQARSFLGLTGPRPTRPVAGHSAHAAGELRLDPHRRVLRLRDREVGLTRLEHDFLHCLVSERGKIWTYQRLHQAVWGNDHLGRGSDIHSVVRRLRRKLRRLGSTATIHSVRGIGLRLEPADT